MTSFGTQVLFIPYGAKASGKKDPGTISQQKHAAREYHRKAKLKRLSQRDGEKPANLVRKDSSSDDGQSIASSSRSGTPLNDRSSSLGYSSQQQLSHRRLPSPNTVLGAARTDPFDSKPVKDLSPHVHYMIDYALTYQWPIFSFVNPGLSADSMKQLIGHRMQVSQASFYCVIYAAATHYALSRVGEAAVSCNRVLRLDYKERALKMLLDSVNNWGNAMPLEVMQAMFAMTSYGSGTTEHIAPLKSRDTKNPLVVSYDLDVYSRLPPEMAHVRALNHIIQQQGGLAALPRPGFAQVMAL